MAVSHVPVVTQMLLFGNDATQVTYSDGSQLQMSPCGAVFVHTKQVKQTSHPLQDLHRVQQRTQFVTSEFKAKVLEALEFRNRFAERPYICGELLDGKKLLNVHADIDKFRWPTERSAVKLCKDGSVCVTALDGHACLTLAPHLQEFSVKYLAKVGRALSRNAEISGVKGARREEENRFLTIAMMEMDGSFTGTLPDLSPRQRAEERLPGNRSADIVGEERGKEMERSAVAQDKVSKTQYVWMIQHISVAACPDRWKQPLHLALHCRSDVDSCQQSPMGDDVDAERNGKQQRTCVTTERSPAEKQAVIVTSAPPATLSLSCPASHLHRWNSDPSADGRVLDNAYNVQQEKLKVGCTDGVIYRLHWGGRPSVEVYPGDGSIIKSKGPTGCFFTHCWYEDSTVAERVYSSENPPPDTPRLSYSIRKFIKQAARLFYHMPHQNLSIIEIEPTCCWKAKSALRQPTVPIPTSVLEETQIPDLGRFSAYTDGRVRILFADRTMLDMKWDFSKRLLGKRGAGSSGLQEDVNDIENDPPHPSLSLPKIRADQAVPNGACRLLLSNGQYQIVNLHQPCGFYKYVSVAMEWAAWVNSSPNERLNFYEGRDVEFNKTRTVAAELKKIETFNYLMENTNIPSRHDLGLKGTRQGNSMPQDVLVQIPGPRVGPAMVQEVLKRTLQTITDINSLLDKS